MDSIEASIEERTTAPPIILPLADADGSPSLTGGKAANLARMMRAGLCVPDGFCVTTTAFRLFVQGIEVFETLCRSLKGLDQVGDCGRRLREQMSIAPFPAGVEAQILAAWQAMGTSGDYAVRSSATAEDLPRASFAGQMDSFLNVRGAAAILGAVRKCWISFFSDRAILYRMRNGIPLESAGMAVVVQEMVPAEIAGVLFTVDPAGRGDRMVLEAVRGLGDALVSGRTTPERALIARDTLRVVERDGRSCISDEIAQRIAELGRRGERIFGCPQDVEWAMAGGRIDLLQSRPITTLPSAPPAEQDVWSNVNTGEVLPDVATPMTWAVVDLIIRKLLGPLVKQLGVDVSVRPWFGLIAGRVYANVTVFAEILDGLPLSPDLTEGFGGFQASVAPVHLLNRPHTAMWRKLLRLLPAAPRLIAHASTGSGNAFLAEWRRRCTRVTEADVRALSDEALAGFIPESVDRVCKGSREADFGSTVMGSMGAGLGCAMALSRLTRRWLDDQDGSVANALLGGAGEMDSADSALDLCRLAAWARENPPVDRVLLEHPGFSAARAALEATPHGREFLRQWQTFMLRHGHHTRGEVDVYNPRWSETPDYVLDMVRAHLRAVEGADPLELRRHRLAGREQLAADCRKRLRNPIKAGMLRYFIRKGQQGLRMRENVKSEAVRVIAAIRRALLEMGSRLVQRGIIQGRDDVFFLKLEELPPVLRGKAEFDITTSIAQRKAEYLRNRSLTPPPVIVGQFDPKLAKALEPPAGSKVLKGLAVSPGVAIGPARVILRADADQRVLSGEILVAPFTDPGWSLYFLTAAGIVVDMGGQLSHGSVVAREYGIPAVVNVGPATQVIQTGQRIQVDGNRGVVTILSQEPS